nr:HNH endonuclease signature motif containing protein [Litorivivens lipolytica]
MSNFEIVEWLRSVGIDALPKAIGQTNKKAYKYELENGEVFFIKRSYHRESGIEIPMVTRPLVMHLDSCFRENIYAISGVHYDENDSTTDSAAYAGFPRVVNQPRGRDFGVESQDTLHKVIEVLSGRSRVDVAEEGIFTTGEANVDGDLNDVDETVCQHIKSRRGQAAFRLELLNEYSHSCAVTGSRVLSVLEAAHIVPHSEVTDYSADNGLLLRSDIHTLFDLGFITVSDDGVIRLAEPLHGTEYGDLEGKKIAGSITIKKRENLRLRSMLQRQELQVA